MDKYQQVLIFISSYVSRAKSATYDCLVGITKVMKMDEKDVQWRETKGEREVLQCVCYSCCVLFRFRWIFLACLCSRRAFSSCSWLSRHLWKFSTTTPTNMLSTKKPTSSRNEMKYARRHSLWFVFGYTRHNRTSPEPETEADLSTCIPTPAAHALRGPVTLTFDLVTSRDQYLPSDCRALTVCLPSLALITRVVFLLERGHTQSQMLRITLHTHRLLAAWLLTRYRAPTRGETICTLHIVVGRGHTVQPPSEWDRRTDRLTDHCFMPPYLRARRNNNKCQK